MMSSMLNIVLAFALFMGNVLALSIDVGNILSGELAFKIEAKLNKPIHEELIKEIGLSDNTSAEFDIKYKMSDDYKKLEMQLDMTATNGIDKPAKVTFWCNVDYSDRNIPKELIITKSQDDERYSVMNIQSPAINNKMTAIGMIGNLFTADKFNLINKAIADKITGNITEKDGTYSMIMDEATLKSVIKEIVLGTSEVTALMYGVNMNTYTTTASSVSVIGGADGPTSVYVSETVPTPRINVMKTEEDLKEQIHSQINEFFAKLDNVKLFKKDALVLNMKLDDKNQPKNVNYSINVDTNLCDLVKSMGGDWDESIPKEDSNIDITITLDYAFSKVNEEITIEYPKLTKENSMDMTNGMFIDGIDINAVNIVRNNDNLAELNNKPFIKDGTAYLPLREMLNLNGIANEDIIWDNGTISLKVYGESTILKIDSDEFIRNNNAFRTGKAVLLQEGVTYIPDSLLGELRIGGMTNTFYDDNGKIVGCVVSIFQYVSRASEVFRFLIPSDIAPMWHKYIYMASDKAGVKIDVIESSIEDHWQRLNLVIAAGDPHIIIGKFEDEQISKLLEQGAIHPVLRINDEYVVVIPRTFKNIETVNTIIYEFIDLINKG